MNSRPSNVVLFLTFLFTVLVWGTSWLVIKISLDQGIPPMWGTSIRFLFASVFMALILIPRLRNLHLSPGQWKLTFIHGAFIVAVSNLLVFWGQQFIDSNLSSIIFAVFPLMVAVFSHFMLTSERFTLLRFIGIAIGFTGILLIFFDPAKIAGSNAIFLGMSAIFVSVATTAWPSVLIKREAEDLHPVLLNSFGIFIGTAILLISTLLVEGPPPLQQISSPVLISLAYLGLFGSGINFIAYFWLMKYVDITKLSLSAYLTPIVAILAAALFYGEIISGRNVLAMFIIFTGIFVFNMQSPAPSSSQDVPDGDSKPSA